VNAGVKKFTLVELIIIVVVIAGLTALLLLVFSSSRMRDRNAVCKSNLRQMGLGMQLYRSDNDESYPDTGAIGAKDASGVEYMTANYRRALGEDDGGGGGPEVYGLAVALRQYLGNNKKIWLCPGATSLKQSYKNTYAWYSTYFSALAKSKGKSFRPTSVSPGKFEKTPIIFDNISYEPVPTGRIVASARITSVREKIGPHKQGDPYEKTQVALYQAWVGVYGVSATGVVTTWTAGLAEP